MLQPSYTTILLVRELATLRNEITKLNKRGEEIKAELRSFMGAEKLLVADNYCVIIEMRNRTDFNKDALLHDMGHEFVTKYQKRVEFEMMHIKPLQKTG